MIITETTLHTVVFNDEEWAALKLLGARAQQFKKDNYHLTDNLEELEPLFKKLGLAQ